MALAAMCCYKGWESGWRRRGRRRKRKRRRKRSYATDDESAKLTVPREEVVDVAQPVGGFVAAVDGGQREARRKHGEVLSAVEKETLEAVEGDRGGRARRLAHLELHDHVLGQERGPEAERARAD